MADESISPREPDEQPPKRNWRKSILKRFLRGVGALVLLLALVFLYVRFVRRNFHAVVDGQVYRSAQPTGEHFRAWHADHGFKTVLNLRGSEDLESVQQVMAAAEQLGVTYINLRLPNYELPPPRDIGGVIDVLETAERPLLFHCRAGADRSGIVGVMAAMAVGGQPYEQARRHLSVAYLHVDPARHHAGGFIKLYDEYLRQSGLPAGGWEQFRDWALNVYPGVYLDEMGDEAERPDAGTNEANRVE